MLIIRKFIHTTSTKKTNKKDMSTPLIKYVLSVFNTVKKDLFRNELNPQDLIAILGICNMYNVYTYI